jgi:hypothetical protein
MGLFTFGGSAASSLQERVSILDDGNVGIGTQVPGYLLDVNGRARLRHNGATSGLWLNKADNTEAAFIGMFNDTTYGFFGNNTWRTGFDVKNARIGVDVMNPTAALSFSSTVGNKIALWGDAAGGHYGLGIQGSLLQMYASASNADVAFGYGSSNAFTENMRVKGTGNVGIGVTNPGATLEVKRGTGVGGTAQFNGTTNSSHFNYGTTEDTYVRGGKITSKVFVNDQSSGNVLMADGGGNVGIGSPNPVNKLEVSANNTNAAGYFQQNGSGAAINAFSPNGTGIYATTTSATLPAINATSVGASPAIIANGKIKINDGTQADGKVLTSDAAGNASWQAQAYGTTERFQFRISAISTNPSVFTTIYNYGSATGLLSGNDEISIGITKAGLYHFDINAYQNTHSDYSITGSYPYILFVSYGTTNNSLNGYSPFYKLGAGAITYSSFDKSYEVYVAAGSVFIVSCPKLIGLDNYKLTITGHLISE